MTMNLNLKSTRCAIDVVLVKLAENIQDIFIRSEYRLSPVTPLKPLHPPAQVIPFPHTTRTT